MPNDLRKPGHIFPLRAHPEGVLKRAGHTEGSVDLCRLAGFWPAAVICEVLNQDGAIARAADLLKFSQQHQIKIGSIESLISYLRDTSKPLDLR
jgi:3,4-dihydroxy 2-butanone 4-phosphate synthase/GTP cyclohydrolase II